MRALGWLTAALLLCTIAACGGGTTDHPVKDDTPISTTAPEEPPVSAAISSPSPTPASVKTKKVIVLDPGHGGDEIGASANGVVEKDSNLDMAFRVEKLLIAAGFDVVLTRRSDDRAAQQQPGYTATRTDLQARLDLANAAGGDLLVSIHSNGSDDPSQRGVEAWYDSSRAYAAEGTRLAGLLKDNVIASLRDYGYAASDRGLFDGVCFRSREGRCFTLFVIAGPRQTSRAEVMQRGGNPEALGFNGQPFIYSRPANMPAALVELLILTNASDAAVMRNEAGRNAVAKGVANAVQAYFAQSGG